MKRMVSKLKKWFRRYTVGEIIRGIISALLVIPVCIMVFMCADTTPATEADYEPLEMQAKMVQEIPNSLFETQCTIDVRSEEIKVTLESDQCKVIAKYDKNFNLLSTRKEDKAWFWLVALFMCIFLGWVLSCAVYSVLEPLSQLIIAIYQALVRLNRKIKRSRN